MVDERDRPLPARRQPRLTAARFSEASDGAIAAMTAIALVALLGFGAIVVDVGAIYVERRELQNSADAAALAVAYQCAGGDCGDIDATAQELADLNARDGVVDVQSVEVTDSQVTVATSTRTSDGGTAIAHVLAPILRSDGSFDSTTVRASATAVWGGPSGGTAIIPLAISWCSFEYHTGGGEPSTEIEQTISYLDGSESDCVGPSGHTVPGGFGWLEPDDGTCSATSSINDPQTPGKPGISVPSTCGEEDWTKIRNETILLPIFDQAGGTGESGWFHIHGYAAFEVTAYRFGCSPPDRWNDDGSGCSADSRFIRGYFTKFVLPDDTFSYGGPSLGANVVALTL